MVALEKNGFAYKFEDFVIRKIEVEQIEWKLNNLDEIKENLLKVCYRINTYVKSSRKKVLIHCHSGQKKSCLIYCALLIIRNNDPKVDSDIMLDELANRRHGLVIDKMMRIRLRKFEKCTFITRY